MEFLNRSKTDPGLRQGHPVEPRRVLARSSLDKADALGAALAAAYAAKSKTLVDAIRGSALSKGDVTAALSAAALMGMNNVWYPYVEMADDEALRTPARGASHEPYATHGGVDKKRFELFSLPRASSEVPLLRARITRCSRKRPHGAAIGATSAGSRR